MFSHTMSFKNACSSDSSAVMRFDGSNVSIRSNKSRASAGILRKTKQTIIKLAPGREKNQVTFA